MRATTIRHCPRDECQTHHLGRTGTAFRGDIRLDVPDPHAEVRCRHWRSPWSNRTGQGKIAKRARHGIPDAVEIDISIQ